MALKVVRGLITSDPDDDELVDVVVPSFDVNQKFTGCIYMPRGDQVPTEGTNCLVAFDELGAAWVIAWQ